jgi:hypothetical protein
VQVVLDQLTQMTMPPTVVIVILLTLPQSKAEQVLKEEPQCLQVQAAQVVVM